MGVFERKSYKILAAQTPVTINTASWESVGPSIAALALAAPTSTAWPTANRAIYVPFTLRAPLTVVKLFSGNGSALSGNIDMGIYNAAGTRLVSKGSTAHAGASLQSFDITDTLLIAGQYYMAVALDNATGALCRWTATSPVSADVAWGVATEASAFPLPATATFASMTALAAVYIPLIGLTGRTVV